LMNKISRTVRGGEEVARNVRKGRRTLDEEDAGGDGYVLSGHAPFARFLWKLRLLRP
jgi:hypothetical protein